MKRRNRKERREERSIDKDRKRKEKGAKENERDREKNKRKPKRKRMKREGASEKEKRGRRKRHRAVPPPREVLNLSVVPLIGFSLFNILILADFFMKFKKYVLDRAFGLQIARSRYRAGVVSRTEHRHYRWETARALWLLACSA